MSQEEAPRLSHVGLYVTDVPKMTDFYTKVLGFVVSDRAEDGRVTFLSRNPSDHHQVVLVRGRTTDATVPMVQQVSFNVGTLANVRRAFRKVCEAGCKVIDPRCHGNAWSVYFSDPEGNRIEMFCDTPWYVPQPLGFEIDLSKSEDELYHETEAICRAKPGFKPMEEWRAEISRKIEAQLEYADQLDALAPH
jgi:catechol 2,3-dioxygenase-like lactoylglutathione lyase family enzyme